MILQDDVLRVLFDWNPWEKDFETGYPRSKYVKKLEDFSNSGQIVVVTGLRRAGKTYIMRQFTMHLIKNGVPRKNIFFLNLEDPRLGSLDANVLDEIFHVYLDNLSPEGEPYVFLDEIQELTLPRLKSWDSRFSEGRLVDRMDTRSAAVTLSTGVTSRRPGGRTT